MSVAILIVEDEQPIRELMTRYLSREGYHVQACDSVETARRMLAERPPDLVILDIMLPGEDGLSFCREIRAHSNLPIIFVSARQDEVDRIVGLELGGDDYLGKPFSPRELVARVRTVLRRAAPEPIDQKIVVGDIEIRPRERRGLGPHGDLQLTSKEFDVLEIMARHVNHAFSRDQLLDRVWGYDYHGETRAIDDTIRRIRKKLRVAGCTTDVTTVWGYGYKLER